VPEGIFLVWEKTPARLATKPRGGGERYDPNRKIARLKKAPRGKGSSSRKSIAGGWKKGTPSGGGKAGSNPAKKRTPPCLPKRATLKGFMNKKYGTPLEGKTEKEHGPPPHKKKNQPPPNRKKNSLPQKPPPPPKNTPLPKTPPRKAPHQKPERGFWVGFIVYT